MNNRDQSGYSSLQTPSSTQNGCGSVQGDSGYSSSQTTYTPALNNGYYSAQNSSYTCSPPSRYPSQQVTSSHYHPGFFGNQPHYHQKKVVTHYDNDCDQVPCCNIL